MCVRYQPIIIAQFLLVYFAIIAYSVFNICNSQSPSQEDNNSSLSEAFCDNSTKEILFKKIQISLLEAFVLSPRYSSDNINY